jgi:hypothetical protein
VFWGGSLNRGTACSYTSAAKAINSCQCQWPKAQLVENCGAEATCVSSDVGAVSCKCLAGQWYNGTGCLGCSDCGSGEKVSECTGSSDTVCKCPDGKTGNKCESGVVMVAVFVEGSSDKCRIPISCVAFTELSCVDGTYALSRDAGGMAPRYT